ncbi:MAG: AAA family ATPase [Caldilineaceae bacterium]
MMGFTEQEVATILSGVNVAGDALTTTLGDMRQWYNGWSFNNKAQTRLYNPDMVLFCC